jgi:hypothetical protein
MSGRGCGLDHEVSSGARGAFFEISAYLTAYLSPYCRFADDWAEQEPRGQRGARGIVVIRPLADAFFGFSVSVPERPSTTVEQWHVPFSLTLTQSPAVKVRYLSQASLTLDWTLSAPWPLRLRLVHAGDGSSDEHQKEGRSLRYSAGTSPTTNNHRTIIHTCIRSSKTTLNLTCRH